MYIAVMYACVYDLYANAHRSHTFRGQSVLLEEVCASVRASERVSGSQPRHDPASKTARTHSHTHTQAHTSARILHKQSHPQTTRTDIIRTPSVHKQRGMRCAWDLSLEQNTQHSTKKNEVSHSIDPHSYVSHTRLMAKINKRCVPWPNRHGSTSSDALRPPHTSPPLFLHHPLGEQTCPNTGAHTHTHFHEHSPNNSSTAISLFFARAAYTENRVRRPHWGGRRFVGCLAEVRGASSILRQCSRRVWQAVSRSFNRISELCQGGAHEYPKKQRKDTLAHKPKLYTHI